MVKRQRTAIIIGAGPAGLTAAYELATRTDIKPIVIEKSSYVGGLAATIKFAGNRIDIGGHRFFTKSDRVLDWWFSRLPLQKLKDDEVVTYRKRSRVIDRADEGPDPIKERNVFLVRPRKSRIFYQGKFFDYPVKLNYKLFSQLGFLNSVQILFSYLKSVFLPIKPVKNLEEFYTNRFGRKLYEIFFKTYTEKLWMTKCTEISAEWGAQRVKGISVGKAIMASVSSILGMKNDGTDKSKESSLIEKFLYPKYGPGQIWEKTEEEIIKNGGEVIKGFEVKKILVKDKEIMGVEAMGKKGVKKKWKADYVFSSMPVSHLAKSLPEVPKKVVNLASKLEFLDFVVVGLLFNKLSAKIKDTWIYVHDSGVKTSRVQFLNNWSPYLVADEERQLIGMEFTCKQGDEWWQMSRQELVMKMVEEVEKLGLAKKEDLVKSKVVKVKKAYPAYTGVYRDFAIIRNYFDKFENLFLIGRNGMHQYNNQDHSMLTAMVAVDNILSGRKDKSNIWAINTEDEYHEER